MEYEEFIKSKHRKNKNVGFDCDLSNSFLYDFQKKIIEFSLRRGKSAIFADCGLGKTPMQLEFARQIIKKTNGNVLIVTPLAVGAQTCREAEKFGLDANKSIDGVLSNKITVTNYERLHYFDKNDFNCIVLDESSILKNYAGKIRERITEFMKDIPYRLLCTATPAPNDFMEFGTSAEALSVMRRVEMLAEFFIHDSGSTQEWKIKGHAGGAFWEWMSMWSRAIRKPSDLGFGDGDFKLKEMNVNHIMLNSKAAIGRLFPIIASTLSEQRESRHTSIDDRCNAVAEIANENDRPFIAWCDLNDESKKLTNLINGAVEIKGSDTEEHKEKSMQDFSYGNIRCLVTKPSIAGFGMNWQHCADMSFFPSHSHEQFYQATRRCWRFGQTKRVNCHMVYTESDCAIVDNLMRKEKNANMIYDEIIKNMSEFQNGMVENNYKPLMKMEHPKWM